MKQTQKFIAGLLMMSVLIVPLGIVGCGGSNSAAEQAKQEEIARDAEYRQQIRNEELRQAQEETRKKQSEATGQDIENVGAAVTIGSGIFYLLYLVFGGE